MPDGTLGPTQPVALGTACCPGDVIDFNGKCSGLVNISQSSLPTLTATSALPHQVVPPPIQESTSANEKTVLTLTNTTHVTITLTATENSSKSISVSDGPMKGTGQEPLPLKGTEILSITYLSTNPPPLSSLVTPLQPPIPESPILGGGISSSSSAATHQATFLLTATDVQSVGPTTIKSSSSISLVTSLQLPDVESPILSGSNSPLPATGTEPAMFPPIAITTQLTTFNLNDSLLTNPTMASVQPQINGGLTSDIIKTPSDVTDSVSETPKSEGTQQSATEILSSTTYLEQSSASQISSVTLFLSSLVPETPLTSVLPGSELGDITTISASEIQESLLPSLRPGSLSQGPQSELQSHSETSFQEGALSQSHQSELPTSTLNSEMPPTLSTAMIPLASTFVPSTWVIQSQSFVPLSTDPVQSLLSSFTPALESTATLLLTTPSNNEQSLALGPKSTPSPKGNTPPILPLPLGQILSLGPELHSAPWTNLPLEPSLPQVSDLLPSLSIPQGVGAPPALNLPSGLSLSVPSSLNLPPSMSLLPGIGLLPGLSLPPGVSVPSGNSPPPGVNLPSGVSLSSSLGLPLTTVLPVIPGASIILGRPPLSNSQPESTFSPLFDSNLPAFSGLPSTILSTISVSEGQKTLVFGTLTLAEDGPEQTLSDVPLALLTNLGLRFGHSSTVQPEYPNAVTTPTYTPLTSGQTEYTYGIDRICVGCAPITLDGTEISMETGVIIYDKTRIIHPEDLSIALPDPTNPVCILHFDKPFWELTPIE